MPYKAHLFICTNKKQGKPCCGDKGAEELRQRVKQWASEQFGNEVRVNASGCLDKCSEGIAAVLYPQNLWLTGLKSADDERLKEALRAALAPNLDY